MATDTELRNLYEDADVQNKSEIAVLELAADILKTSQPDSAQCRLATDISANPREWGRKFLRLALTQHKDKTEDQVKSYTATIYKGEFAPFVNGIIAGRA